MTDNEDDGLYYDGHDLVGAFIRGVFIGALVAGIITAFMSP